MKLTLKEQLLKYKFLFEIYSKLSVLLVQTMDYEYYIINKDTYEVKSASKTIVNLTNKNFIIIKKDVVLVN